MTTNAREFLEQAIGRIDDARLILARDARLKCKCDTEANLLSNIYTAIEKILDADDDEPTDDEREDS